MGSYRQVKNRHMGKLSQSKAASAKPRQQKDANTTLLARQWHPHCILQSNMPCVTNPQHEHNKYCGFATWRGCPMAPPSALPDMPKVTLPDPTGLHCLDMAISIVWYDTSRSPRMWGTPSQATRTYPVCCRLLVLLLNYHRM